MAHSHSHSHVEHGKRLFITLLFNIAIAAPEIIREIDELMKHKFQIGHCTIQAEMDICPDDHIINKPLTIKDDHE